MTGPAGGGGACWIDALLDSPHWEEVETGLVGKPVLRKGNIVTRFDSVERATLILGFKELREVVLLTFLSYLFLLNLSQEAEKRWFSSLRLLLLYYTLD